MLSRVANSIYWMSRYVERVENLARFVDVTLNFILDQPQGAAEPWRPLVYATGDEKWFAEHYDAATQDNVIEFLTFDPRYPGSIVSSLQWARENARGIREAISSEMWEQLNSFYYRVMEESLHRRFPGGLMEFFQELRQASHLFEGITSASLTRNEGWHFAALGRFLERADKTSRILDVKYFALAPTARDKNAVLDDLQWSSVLRSVSALEMYRKQRKRIAPAKVVEFLLLDEEFPRAIRYCVNEASESLDRIASLSPVHQDCPAKKAMDELKADLGSVNVEALLDKGLHKFIDQLQLKMNSVGAAIHETFFAVRPEEEVAVSK